MIDKQTAKKYVAKLWQMKNFPRESESATGELVLAMECADTEAIAHRATQTFLDHADPDTPCPMPRNIREAIYALQEPVYEVPKPPEPVCPDCEDTGIVGGFLGGPRGIWCDCLSGQRVKAAQPAKLEWVNETYDKLTARFGTKPTTREVLARAANERRALANVTQILGTIDGGRQ